VKRTIIPALDHEPDALERITRLEEQLALVAINTEQHRTLRAAISVEARAYRKTLDFEQANARTAAKF
jgi:hypothetical protein